jgi:alkyl sulfatase BDS1-like metallo-beta-lactamase superfamily hydrolase
VRKSGWFSGNPRDMIKPLPTQEAKHMVELAGGVKQLLKKAQKSLDKGDNGWAVQQAYYLLTVDKETEAAKQIMIKAYRAQAAITVSGMEYNYYVSEAKQLEGTYRYGGIVDFMPVRDAVRSSATDMVEAFSSRFDMTKGEHEFLSVNIQVTDVNETFGLRIDHGIFYRKSKAYADADATITLTKPELFMLIAAFKTPEQLNLNIKGNKDLAFKFFRILGL